jgi:hypothetical protein
MSVAPSDREVEVNEIPNCSNEQESSVRMSKFRSLSLPVYSSFHSNTSQGRDRRRSYPRAVFRREEIPSWDPIDVRSVEREMKMELKRLMTLNAHEGVQDDELQNLSRRGQQTYQTMLKTHDAVPIKGFSADEIGSTSSLFSTTSDMGGATKGQTSLSVNAISVMKKGAALMKHGRRGNPNFRHFQLSERNQFLIWYSHKKSLDQTKIRISDIREVRMGEEHVKDTSLIAKSSFTVVYTTDDSDGDHELELKLTAKNEREAHIWGIGLQVLNSKIRYGEDISDLEELKITPPPTTLKKQETMLDTLETARRGSVSKFFSRPFQATNIKSTRRDLEKLDSTFDKICDWIRAEANYKKILETNQFVEVSKTLEDVEARLKSVKIMVDSPSKRVNQAEIKTKIWIIRVDLDVMKTKLAALIKYSQ